MTTAPRWEVVERTGSTNADVLVRAGEDWPHLSVLLAREQTAGQGRAGRRWHSVDVDALTFSVVVRPSAPRETWGWVPLLAGVAVVRVLRRGAHHPGRIGLKWPNDIVDTAGGSEHVPGWGQHRKLGGLLTQVLPAGDAAVVGIGVNLDGDVLPVPWAGTLRGAGLIASGGSVPHGTSRDWADDLARGIVSELGDLLTAFDTGADPRPVVEPLCVSIGQQVQLDLPGGHQVHGRVRALSDEGALVLHTADGERLITTGDVHLRAGLDVAERRQQRRDDGTE